MMVRLAVLAVCVRVHGSYVNPLANLRRGGGCREVSDILQAFPAYLKRAVLSFRDSLASRPNAGLQSQLQLCAQASPRQLWLGSSNSSAGKDNHLGEYSGQMYRDRFRDRFCHHAKGMWSSDDVARVSKCKYETVAELLKLRAGHWVLDVGAGCGHALDMLSRKHGFGAVAVDMVEPLVSYGRSNMHNIHSYCQADLGNLPFKSNSFHAVIANGVLLHLDGQWTQCRVLRKHVLRVLVPGGCAWFGWMTTKTSKAQTLIHPPPIEFWTERGGCFGSLPNVAVAAFAEHAVFGATEYNFSSLTPPYSIMFCKPTA